MKNFRKIWILVRLIHRISPSYIYLTIFGTLLTSLQIVGNVVLPKFLIDEIMDEKDINTLIFLGGLIVVFNLIFGFINKTYRRLQDVKNNYVEKKINESMAQKIMDIEYHYLEDPYYLDLKERAVFATNNQSALATMIRSFSQIIGNAITLISLSIIMLTLSYILIIVLGVGIMLILIINSFFKKYQVSFFKSLIPINRRFGYYFNLSFDDRYGKDIRLYNMSPLLTGRVYEYNKYIVNKLKLFYFRRALATGAQKAINAIQTGFVYFYVALRVFSSNYGRTITIGDFTMYVNSAINFTLTFDRFFQNIITISQMLDYLDPFLEFMTLPEVKHNRSEVYLNDIKIIEFRDVTFSYPKGGKVLDNISFTINKDEKVSIVGLNGAGKTTLIKLLCRFYSPDSGKILINDIDIFEYDYESYIKRIAAVFQDFRLFAYSILENISGDNSISQDEIKRIIKQVGLNDKINELPLGLDTKLNKDYDEDGVELSGGQGQKVAIARALYKNADLVILDEPTSALDPIAEADIYKNFNDLVLSKTAIYISHRMSSSVFCDRVLIIDGGKISDYDTHQNLMKKKNSLYYELFNSQAKNYQY